MVAAIVASRRRAPSWFGVVAIVTLCVGATSALPAATLTIQGSSTASTALLTPNQAAIEALSGQSIKVVSIRSDIGLLRLLAGQAEFAVISTSLMQSVALLKGERPGLPYERLMSFQVAHARVAFAVNPSNPVRSADLSQIKRILSGEVTNWKQLGGVDGPIRVAYVQAGGGVTQSVVSELLGGKPLMPANPIRVAFGAQVIKVVEQEPRALGVAQLGLTQEHQLPELKTDHVIEQELSLVTLGEPTPEQRAVIDAARQIATRIGMPAGK